MEETAKPHVRGSLLFSFHAQSPANWLMLGPGVGGLGVYTCLLSIKIIILI